MAATARDARVVVSRKLLRSNNFLETIRTRPTLIALLGGALAWELAGRLIHFSFLPPLSDVLAATWRMTLSGEIPSNLGASLFALAVGFGFAVAVGIPLGLLVGRYRTVEYLVDPYLNALLATPSLLYVPILFGIFGTSRITQVLLVFLYSIVVIIINTASGLRGVDVTYVEMARSFGASERQLFAHVLLPGTLPMLSAGLRLGMGRAVRGMINGEMLIVLVGLGALLRKYGSRFDAASVFGILIVVVGVALCCMAVLQFLDRRVNRWS